VQPGNPITLKSGANTVSVEVTAADGVTKNTYIITITYTPPTPGPGPGPAPVNNNGGTGVDSSTRTQTVNNQQAPITTTDLFPFIDVHQGDWFYANVRYCWENGLVNGVTATTFSPNTAITRGMVVTILYRAQGSPDTTGLKNPFGDVGEGLWYSDAVKWGADNGIVKGYPDGTYMPNRAISRQEMAAIIARYSGYASIKLPAVNEYTGFSDDAAIFDYAKTNVKDLYIAGIINGKPNNMFDPLGTATRAEFAAMMNRLLTANG